MPRLPKPGTGGQALSRLPRLTRIACPKCHIDGGRADRRA